MIADRIKELFAEAYKVDLTVLVWGPGQDFAQGDSPYWRKRCQIKDSIQVAFPNAGVFFSEDPELRRHTEYLEDLWIEELVHAESADCILILDSSRGSHFEADRIGFNPRLAPKVDCFFL